MVILLTSVLGIMALLMFFSMTGWAIIIYVLVVIYGVYINPPGRTDVEQHEQTQEQVR